MIETRPKRWVVHDGAVNREEREAKLDNGKEKKIVEPGTSWERGAGWTKVVSLIEIARQRDWSDWTTERKERIFQGVLAGVAQHRERRRVARAFAAGAFTVLLVGLALRLIGVDVVGVALARV